MNKSEYIKAKNILSALTFSLANQKFETVTLADSGDVINISGREVGSEVFAGEGEAVEDGTYKLSDGFEFEVIDSKISKVISEVAVVEEVPLELAEEVTAEVTTIKEEEFKALQDEVKQLRDDLKSLMDSIAEGKTEAVAKEDEFNRKVAAFNTAFAAIVKIPVEDSKVNASPKATLKKEKDNQAMRNLFEATK